LTKFKRQKTTTGKIASNNKLLKIILGQPLLHQQAAKVGENKTLLILDCTEDTTQIGFEPINKVKIIKRR